HFRRLTVEVEERGPEAVRQARDALFYGLHPAEDNVREPEVNENPRGRPRTSTSRIRSYYERSRSRSTGPGSSGGRGRSSGGRSRSSGGRSRSSGGRSRSSGGRSRSSGGRSRSSGGESDEHDTEFVRPLLVGDFNPSPDGHCGFRALSHCIYGDDSHYLLMRSAIV
ncbi:unnamed protein product, partial [Linum tenue]